MATIRQNRHRLGSSYLKMLQREILQYKYPQKEKLGIINSYIEKDKQSRNSLPISNYNGLSLSYVYSCNKKRDEPSGGCVYRQDTRILLSTSRCHRLYTVLCRPGSILKEGGLA